MAVPPFFFEILCRVASEQGGGRACAAGYPDLLVPPHQLKAHLGEQRASRVPVREDSEKIAAWHGLSGIIQQVFESASVFRELGYELDVIDIHASRGGEIYVDLNAPLPASFSRTYDLVIDTGTCEHCFNIGQAAINLGSMVSKSGYIIQSMPLSMFNHGFYNVSPTWFWDFYPSNGFKLLYLQGVTDIVRDPKPFDPPPFDRFNEAPPNAVMIAVAQRETVIPIKPPTQRKYQLNPGLGN